MIKSVDESIDAKLQAHDRLRDDQTSTYSKEVMKEIESLQVENQALKAHLVNQLEVKKENKELKERLDRVKSSESSSSELVERLMKEVQELKSKLELKMTKNNCYPSSGHIINSKQSD